jgi:hypothetical protein
MLWFVSYCLNWGFGRITLGNLGNVACRGYLDLRVLEGRGGILLPIR